MCMNLPPGDLTPALTPHTPQTFILIEWQSHQMCAVVTLKKLYLIYTLRLINISLCETI